MELNKGDLHCKNLKELVALIEELSFSSGFIEDFAEVIEVYSHWHIYIYLQFDFVVSVSRFF